MYSELARNDTVAQILGKQVLRSGTSVGANYREASARRSKAEFVSKIGDCLKEVEKPSTGSNFSWTALRCRNQAGQFARRDTPTHRHFHNY